MGANPNKAAAVQAAKEFAEEAKGRKKILVTPSTLVAKLKINGFAMINSGDQVVASIFNSSSFKRRSDMEVNTAFKQIIPYVLVIRSGSVFTYRRGSAQGEARLHGLRSLGIGGHVEEKDGRNDLGSYGAALAREVQEELGIDIKDSKFKTAFQIRGFVNDDSDDVGKVHFGLIHVIRVNDGLIMNGEESMHDCRFCSPEQLEEQVDEFEKWSQHCIFALTRGLL
jgi:predicted NUDIX family phosphoesterase